MNLKCRAVVTHKLPRIGLIGGAVLSPSEVLTGVKRGSTCRNILLSSRTKYYWSTLITLQPVDTNHVSSVKSKSSLSSSFVWFDSDPEVSGQQISGPRLTGVAAGNNLHCFAFPLIYSHVLLPDPNSFQGDEINEMDHCSPLASPGCSKLGKQQMGVVILFTLCYAF